MQTISLNVEIEEEELSDNTTVFVAHCYPLGIASHGDTIEEAVKNVMEAAELWLEDASAEEIRQRFPAKPKRVFTTKIEVLYGAQATNAVR